MILITMNLLDDEIQALIHSEDPRNRKKAAKLLKSLFHYNSKKEQCYQQLIGLLKDDVPEVRSAVVDILGEVFQKVVDKKHAWRSLLEMI